MSLSHFASAAIRTKVPTWLNIVFVLCVALLFAGELASVSAISGWWFDDLFSLWASEPTLPFGVVFRERILTDFNPPLYFSLLHLVRQAIPDDGIAVIAVNIGAIAVAAAAIYLPSRRAGVSGLAIAGLLSLPVERPRPVLRVRGPLLRDGPLNCFRRVLVYGARDERLSRAHIERRHNTRMPRLYNACLRCAFLRKHRSRAISRGFFVQKERSLETRPGPWAIS